MSSTPTQRGAEKEIENLKRMYATLSGINHAIIHAKTREELFEEACEVAVEKCRFKMAWIGVVEGSEIKPVAACGDVAGYLDKIKISVGDVPSGGGPTRKAIKEGRIVINPDTRINPEVEPWRDEMLKRGYLSSVAIPLWEGGSVIGVFNLYASEPGFFDREEIALVEQLAQDISFGLEHIKKLEELRESELRYRMLVETSPFSVVLCSEGRIVYANPAAVKLAEASSLEELLDKHVLEFVLPKYHSLAQERIKRMERGEIAPPAEMELSTLRGNVIIAEVIGSLIIYRGKPVIQLVIRDITEHKKAEERIKELSQFPEKNPNPIFKVGIDGEILYHNPGVFNYVSDARYVKDLLPPDYKELVRGACASGEKIQAEHRYRQRYIDYIILPVSKTTAHIYGRDITEKKQVEEELKRYAEELEKSQKALLNILEDEREAREKLEKAYQELKTLDTLKDDIIANVSHELRTPMTIAKGFAELAMSEQDEEERKKELMRILEALEKQNAIIGDLIAMAEASKEKLKLRNSHFSIKDLISHAIEKKEREMSKKGIELELHVEDFNIKGDFDKLKHALVNLIDNAIKFNRPQGKISIKARKGKNSAIISVSDTGIGIPKSLLPKIFEPLFQGDASIKRKYGGTGMGLAVVRTIVEAHGGEVYAESPPGEGSTFTLVLPLGLEVDENAKSSSGG
jgi:PAS domain S-box-containing protein